MFFSMDLSHGCSVLVLDCCFPSWGTIQYIILRFMFKIFIFSNWANSFVWGTLRADTVRLIFKDYDVYSEKGKRVLQFFRFEKLRLLSLWLNIMTITCFSMCDFVEKVSISVKFFCLIWPFPLRPNKIIRPFKAFHSQITNIMIRK